jgi:hypothetical protein
MKGSNVWWPLKGSNTWWVLKGSNGRLPMEGFNVWWSLKGEGETSFSPLLTPPPQQFYQNLLFFSLILRFYFTMVLNRYFTTFLLFP